MLVGTQFSGFGAGGKLVQTLIDRMAGTAIGDMTLNGGLAAAFDGVTSQGQANCARVSGAIGHIGKDWGASVKRRVSGFKCWGANNSGYCEGSDPTVTIKLQGSNDNFAAETVDLAESTPVTDSDGGGSGLLIQVLSGVDTSTEYRYHRLKIDTDTCSVKTACAECEFYEDVEG